MREELYRQWKSDEQAPFAGWDFSYLEGRMDEESPPWDYVEIARSLVRTSTSVLDISTGGGEIFSQLAPFPKHTVAVEGWHPNVEVARKRLAPLGVQVVESDSLTGLPFSDETFDLIVNRHGGYNVGEMHRLLQKHGQFFTQQVGGDSLSDLLDFFHASPKWPHMVLNTIKPEFQSRGFFIKRSEEWRGHISFSDVGAVVYFLKHIPWLVDNFSVTSHLTYLEKRQEQLQREGVLKFSSTRYLIHAIKEH